MKCRERAEAVYLYICLEYFRPREGSCVVVHLARMYEGNTATTVLEEPAPLISSNTKGDYSEDSTEKQIMEGSLSTSGTLALEHHKQEDKESECEGSTISEEGERSPPSSGETKASSPASHETQTNSTTENKQGNVSNPGASTTAERPGKVAQLRRSFTQTPPEWGTIRRSSPPPTAVGQQLGDRIRGFTTGTISPRTISSPKGEFLCPPYQSLHPPPFL